MASNSVKLDSSIEKEQVDIIPHSLTELIREQIVFIPSTANSLCRAARYIRTKIELYTNTIHILEYSDSNEVTSIALEQSKHLLDTLSLCKVSFCLAIPEFIP